jgi:hypothetical protein
MAPHGSVFTRQRALFLRSFAYRLSQADNLERAHLLRALPAYLDSWTLSVSLRPLIPIYYLHPTPSFPPRPPAGRSPRP